MKAAFTVNHDWPTSPVQYKVSDLQLSRDKPSVKLSKELKYFKKSRDLHEWSIGRGTKHEVFESHFFSKMEALEQIFAQEFKY